MAPRILFFTLPVQGHLSPALPVVRALVEGGAQVDAVTTPPYAAPLRAAGAQVHLYPDPVPTRPDTFSSNPVEVATMLARLTEQELLTPAREVVAQVAPDVVLVDSMAPWGRLAARDAGLPVVTSTSSFLVHAGLGASLTGAVDMVRSAGGAARALGELVAIRRRLGRQGLDLGGPLTLLSNRGDQTIVYTARAFQPGAGRLGADVHFVGSTLGDASGTDGAPYGAPDAATADLLRRVGPGPLRYVSLGTIYNDRPEFLRACIEALSGASRPVVVSTGSRVDPLALGPLPPQVHLVPFAPQLDLLARAELFVTHAGMNSVSEALWHGVPMLAFPQAADQPVVAARLRRLGAARILRGAEPDAARIGREADLVLRGGEAAAAADRIGQQLREGGGARRAAEIILSCAGR